MGTIEKRGKSAWRVGFQVKRMGEWEWVRQTVHFDPLLPDETQREMAREMLEKMERAAASGSGSFEAYTVRSWSDVWMEKHVRPNCSPVTYGNYRQLLDSRILPRLGDYQLTELTPLILTDWLAGIGSSQRQTTRLEDDRLARKRAPSQRLIDDKKMAKPLSEKTIMHYYQCLYSMLSVAVRLEVLDHNPMEKVQRPKVHRKRVNFLDEEQAVQLLRLLKDESNMCFRAAVLLALLCGLRLGEVCALKLEDVDWDKWQIDISRALKYAKGHGSYNDAPKSEAGNRIISLPAGMMTVLEETRKYSEECRALAPDIWRDEGWIVHRWDGGQVNHDTPSKWFRKFADAHGFEGVRFHDLRHTHATILLANNVDVVAVARRLGHDDPNITLRVYAHALDRRDKDAADTIDKLFGDMGEMKAHSGLNLE